ncbi:hypothetical protein PAAG_07068 [Paracoccidioides lutzii Pb01]|uniref:Uncharacterized protein n=1 Tax=Paracoccidioides lutzii (strain ATCC MYA-826 / Pb01) TaxID=502779 RepID=C1H891_PARBA|nr:hypothetical protein PAAG_07068 [Paracoccidioides lutzii Pb01]EEH36650.2 hypothetical protein PAAG_07068 [Paracoccidioides lutzii Pb01]
MCRRLLGFPDGYEDIGQEKTDESLPDPSTAVECGLVGSAGTKTLPGDGSSTPVPDSIPQAGLLKRGPDQDTLHRRREWPQNSQGDGPLPDDPPIVVGSDDSTTDGSSVDSTFTSPALLAVQHLYLTLLRRMVEATKPASGTASGRSNPLKRQRRPGVGTGAVAIEVPVITDRLEEDINSMRYENGLSSRLRTRQRKTRARSKREVPDTQDCMLPGKHLQCVEDDTAMSDTGGSSAHSGDTDNGCRPSSEEDSPTKPPPKRRRLPTLPCKGVAGEPLKS